MKDRAVLSDDVPYNTLVGLAKSISESPVIDQSGKMLEACSCIGEVARGLWVYRRFNKHQDGMGWDEMWQSRAHHGGFTVAPPKYFVFVEDCSRCPPPPTPIRQRDPLGPNEDFRDFPSYGYFADAPPFQALGKYADNMPIQHDAWDRVLETRKVSLACSPPNLDQVWVLCRRCSFWITPVSCSAQGLRFHDSRGVARSS